MKGRIAVVSGAAQGIGEAVVHALAARGAQVAALDVQGERLRALAECLPGQVQPHALDVADGKAVAHVVATIEADMGPIDMLVNGAGILRTGSCLEQPVADWMDTFAVNAHGVFHLSRAVAQHMRLRRQGAIVTIGSNAAAVPRQHMGAYAAAKAAAHQFTRCLGLELAGEGIRCNIVSPGSTDTPMLSQVCADHAAAARTIRGSLECFKTGIPLGRIARAQDIAEAVVFLLGDAARHITLHDLRVDGGATLGA